MTQSRKNHAAGAPIVPVGEMELAVSPKPARVGTAVVIHRPQRQKQSMNLSSNLVVVIRTEFTLSILMLLNNIATNTCLVPLFVRVSKFQRTRRMFNPPAYIIKHLNREGMNYLCT
jgi:hypothetical protein